MFCYLKESQTIKWNELIGMGFDETESYFYLYKF